MQSHPTPKLYLSVFFVLMALLAITVAAAFAPLEKIGLGGGNWIRRASLAIAMTIAIAKALLIILYFMHVRFAPRMTWVFAGAAFLWLAIMLTLMLSDYVTRDDPSNPSNSRASRVHHTKVQ